jgi:YfiH family protein
MLTVDLGDGIRAGFTTRVGGVSPAPWDSLNLGPNVADAPENVAANRATVCEAMGVPVAYATQIHAARVLTLGDGDRALWASNPPITAGEADAMVTATPGLGLAVLVADCVPVLFADAESSVIGVAHAGRRGIELGVIGQAAAAMIAAGATSANLRAAIGPAICGRCYEVPGDMREAVAAVVPEAHSRTRDGSPSLDLPAAAAAQLAGAGVAHITRVGDCTLENPHLFSHRRATRLGITTGRQAGIVAISR